MSCRPSVESVIRTKIVFTGATEVPSTFQVTVCVEPLAQLTAVFGAVTANGPETLSTVTTVLASLVPPPPPLLSRTVTRKFKVRLAFANTSPPSNSGSWFQAMAQLPEPRYGQKIAYANFITTIPNTCAAASARSDILEMWR